VSRKPRILVSCDHYLPGVRAGGPIRSISALVATLGGELDFRIVTRDRDLGATTPYPGVRPGVWMVRGGAQVLYWPAGDPSPAAWERVLRAVQPDVVYLNSLFSPRYSLAPLALRRLGRAPEARWVVAPRGELHPGALAIRAWKKQPFLRLARAAGLLDGAVWHATAAEEAEHVRACFGDEAHVVVAPVVSALRAASEARDSSEGDAPAAAPRLRAAKRPGRLEVAFLSRVSPKKNLLGAIELLHGVPGAIHLNLYGPKEDAAYWERCRRAIAALPSNVQIRDHGEVAAADVPAALARNHVLLLPTFGENFGHVILESLLAGVPVLVSDQTPWRDLERRRAGWDLALADADGFRSRLAALVSMDEAELAPWSRGAREAGVAYARDPEAVRRSRDLLTGAIAA
jgi:glycosyltransferase involved in cell wall biosynthesis